MDQPTGQAAVDAVTHMLAKEPGTEGFWEVWGTRPMDLRPGDVLMSKDKDGNVHVDYIASIEGTGASGARLNYTDHTGRHMSIGLLAPHVILRWGTHATLSDSVR